jgi:hypothetical protein
MELVVVPVLTHMSSADVLAASQARGARRGEAGRQRRRGLRAEGHEAARMRQPSPCPSASSSPQPHPPPRNCLPCRARTQVFDTFHADHHHTMGIRGFSLDRTYQMLQHADEYRSWALLGFLACPSALAGVGARAALAGLLSETLVMHVYEDRVEPVHPLYEQHVRPSLEKLTEASLCWGGVCGG